MTSLSLGPALNGACPVRDAQGRQVGNLKLIGGRWKFKAIGHDELGHIIPGGGPLTDRHNSSFDRLDAAEISARLLGG
jgi:hypothetical protein